jgi:integrase
LAGVKIQTEEAQPMPFDKRKLDVGTIYRKVKDGNFYYRYQLNHQRKAVSLGTDDLNEAIAKAKSLAPVVKASSTEVIAAHVKHARSLERQSTRMLLSEAWQTYDRHPDRATPATINIYQRYKAYFGEFVEWAVAKGYQYLDEITDRVVADYVKYLKTTKIGVDTHNKRIGRIAHVFRTLSEYTKESTSDWRNPNFKRKPREEFGLTARRLPFTKAQEEELFKVLEDPDRHCVNKEELRILFHLGAYTGQRLKDCALLQWHKVNLERGRIDVVQFKTGKNVTIPIAPQLMTVLKEALEWKTDSYVLPKTALRYQNKNAAGKDVGSGALNQDIMRVIKWTGLQPSVKVTGRARAVSVYGFHSLRHSFVSFCLEHNISKAVVVSILGSDSDIIDQYYTHIGDEAQEQAIQLISGNGLTPKQRIKNALNFIEGLNKKSSELKKVESILRG